MGTHGERTLVRAVPGMVALHRMPARFLCHVPAGLGIRFRNAVQARCFICWAMRGACGLRGLLARDADAVVVGLRRTLVMLRGSEWQSMTHSDGSIKLFYAGQCPLVRVCGPSCVK